MKWTDLEKKVEQKMSTERFQHTLRVAEEAKKLAALYDVDEDRAYEAGLLHDYAREMPIEQMRELIIQQSLMEVILDYHPAIWHGPVGAYLIQQDLNVSDQDILAAVCYHTTARAGMSVLEMIIFVADYIEPGRKLPAIDQLRENAAINLQETVLQILKNNIRYIVSREEKIFPDTLYAYNEFVSAK